MGTESDVGCVRKDIELGKQHKILLKNVDWIHAQLKKDRTWIHFFKKILHHFQTLNNDFFWSLEQLPAGTKAITNLTNSNEGVNGVNCKSRGDVLFAHMLTQKFLLDNTK